jgi:hypothetical protein
LLGSLRNFLERPSAHSNTLIKLSVNCLNFEASKSVQSGLFRLQFSRKAVILNRF